VNAVLFQLVPQLQQILHTSVIVGVNRHPLAPLSIGIGRIQVDAEIAIDMSTNSGVVELLRLLGLVVAGQIPADLSVHHGFGGLDAVLTAVDEQLYVVIRQRPAHLEMLVRRG
jgi:hypothetical protein